MTYNKQLIKTTKKKIVKSFIIEINQLFENIKENFFEAFYLANFVAKVINHFV